MTCLQGLWLRVQGAVSMLSPRPSCGTVLGLRWDGIAELRSFMASSTGQLWEPTSIPMPRGGENTFHPTMPPVGAWC